MYSIDTTKRFDKDLKRCLKRGLDLQHIYDAIALLRTTGTLPVQYRPHKLSGSKDGQWEQKNRPLTIYYYVQAARTRRTSILYAIYNSSRAVSDSQLLPVVPAG